MGDDAIAGEPRPGSGARGASHLPADRAALPLAAARNRGVEHLAEQGVDVVVLLDVDCLAGFSLVSSYAEAVRSSPLRLWSGPVTYLPYGVVVDHPAELAAHDRPHPARPAPAPGRHVRSEQPSLFWSLSFATTPDTWARAGGFDEGYVGYGGEDTDFARRAQAAGVESWWVGGARAYHQFHPVSSPPVEHLDAILRNGRRYAQRWGEWPMQGWLEAFEALGLVRREGEDWVRAGRG